MISKISRIVLTIVLGLLTLLAFGTIVAQEAQSQGQVGIQAAMNTAFTYQGELKKDGQPITDTCSMVFSLYEQETGGNQVGSTVTTTVSVNDSLFTVNLDFGSDAFTGDARWLEIKVKCSGDSNYVALGRRELTAAPYALHARSAGALQGQPVSATIPTTGQALKWIGNGWSPATDDDTTYSAGTGLTLNGTIFSVVTSTIQQRVSGVCSAGYSIRVVNQNGSVVCEADDDTTYTAGTGLNLAADEFSVDYTTVASISHTHPGDNITSAVATATVALSATQTSWNGITNIPADIADGDDVGITAESDPVFEAWDKSTGLSITESQISDLDHFTNAAETDQVFTAWNKSTGISITESQISDLNHFTNAAETDPEVGANTTGYVPKWNGSALISGAIYDNGNVGIGTTSPNSPLEVAGMIHSTNGGLKFPDGTIQTTAADYDRPSLHSFWIENISGAAYIYNFVSSQVVLGSGSGGSGAVNITNNKSFSVLNGTLIFKGLIQPYEDNNHAYGDGQPRGLVNGTDRNKTIEFISASGSSIKARTVNGGTATETVYSLGSSVNSMHFYTIEATATEVKFYLDGDLIATHTSNIPTSPLNVYLGTSYSGGGNVPISADYVSYEIIRSGGSLPIPIMFDDFD